MFSSLVSLILFISVLFSSTTCIYTIHTYAHAAHEQSVFQYNVYNFFVKKNSVRNKGRCAHALQTVCDRHCRNFFVFFFHFLSFSCSPFSTSSHSDRKCGYLIWNRTDIVAVATDFNERIISEREQK